MNGANQINEAEAEASRVNFVLYEGPRTIDGDASVIFTYEDYLIRNPPSFNLHEVDLAIELEWKEAAYLEWKGMTARDVRKLPFLKR
ncbi:hypothetical protein OROHE_017583 [Orobanche hederae]